MITQQEQVGFCKKYRNKWERGKKIVLGGNNKEYTVTVHMKWANQENVGVLHLGIHLEKL